jgi:hypothetical protein
MTLIEVFSDYIRNKKSLKEYIEVRKTINERGEFNDNTLLEVQEYLDKLKEDDPEVYDLMYCTLEQYYREDKGHIIDYPLNFVRQILKIYRHNIPTKKVYEGYLEGLNHPCRDA